MAKKKKTRTKRSKKVSSRRVGKTLTESQVRETQNADWEAHVHRMRERNG